MSHKFYCPKCVCWLAKKLVGWIWISYPGFKNGGFKEAHCQVCGHLVETK